jgi:hypothetical protein
VSQAKEGIIIPVTNNVIDLGLVHETLGKSSKVVELKISSGSPVNFKVKFKYKYRLASKELYGAFISPSGDLHLLTAPKLSDIYIGKSRVHFDISQSTVLFGDNFSLILEISRPKKSSSKLLVVVRLKDNEENRVIKTNWPKSLFHHSFEVIGNQECSELNYLSSF